MRWPASSRKGCIGEEIIEYAVFIFQFTFTLESKFASGVKLNIERTLASKSLPHRRGFLSNHTQRVVLSFNIVKSPYINPKVTDIACVYFFLVFLLLLLFFKFSSDCLWVCSLLTLAYSCTFELIYLQTFLASHVNCLCPFDLSFCGFRRSQRYKILAPPLVVKFWTGP